MLAGCLYGAGYFMGDKLMPPNEQNPKGYYESFEIEAINEDLLAQVTKRRPGGLLGRLLFGHRPRRPQRWLAEVPPSIRFVVDSELAQRMRAQLGHPPYCFKDPRFCYTLPAWRPMLSNPVFMVVFREPGRTAISIMHTVAREPYLRDFRTDAERIFRVWTAQYRHVLDWQAEGGDWLFLHYDQVLDGSAEARIDEALGGRIDMTFPERVLKRSPDDLPAPPEVQRVYAKLCERAGYHQ
jgi:hypothetical protein